METAIYYRETELVSVADYQRFIKVFGENKYSRFPRYVIDQNSGSGLHVVTELLATIWNNNELNERNNSLINRINKGLTKSRSRDYDYVEEYLLIKLIEDATILFNKLDPDEKIQLFKLPIKEFLRIYNIPFESIMTRVEYAERMIGIIPKPSRQIEFTRKYPSIYDGSETAYQMHTILIKKIPYDLSKKISPYGDCSEICKKFSNLGKIYKSYDDDYIQINLYDYFECNDGLMNVLIYLEELGCEF